MAARASIADTSVQQKAVIGALSKKDPAIIRVVDTAAHVALYEFDEVKQIWARGKVEGALHVVERLADPRYQLVVVNRLSPENRVEDVTPELQIQDQDPYMFYKNRRGETHGIWFYNSQDRERIVAFIEGLDEKEMNVPKVEEPPAVMTDSESDIMRFFAGARPRVAASVATSKPAATQHAVNPYMPLAPNVPMNAPISAHLPQHQPAIHNLPPAPHMHVYPPYMPPMTATSSVPSHINSSSSPSNASVPRTSTQPPQSVRAPTLTKQQLKEALMRLAQDDDFIDLVFSKYSQAP